MLARQTNVSPQITPAPHPLPVASAGVPSQVPLLRQPSFSRPSPSRSSGTESVSVSAAPGLLRMSRQTPPHAQKMSSTDQTRTRSPPTPRRRRCTLSGYMAVPQT